MRERSSSDKTPQKTRSVGPNRPRRTYRRYARAVARSLHVRLDEASAAALDVVRAGAMTESEAVRVAIREAAARRRERAAIRGEVRRLAADDVDRDEMRAIRAQMADPCPTNHGK